MAYHSDEEGLSLHTAYVWEYADATTRNAATGFVTEDIGKLSRQLDDDTLWMLIDTTPTWVQIGYGALPGPHAYAHSDGGIDEVTVENLATSGTLGQLLAADASGGLEMIDQSDLSSEQHKTLRHLIHFINEGPAEGFTSGAYREQTGTVKPTSVIWYTDSGKTEKIVEKSVTWTGINPTTIEWEMYATDGSTVLATVTDTISYTGIFETSRTRAIVVA